MVKEAVAAAEEKLDTKLNDAKVRLYNKIGEASALYVALMEEVRGQLEEA